MQPIHPMDVIQHKRDGLALTTAEIQSFVAGLVARATPADTPTDAQAAALLMAIFLRGLEPRELADLTQAMRISGEVFDSAPLGRFTVDKHSTGGVGDKTSLLIAPIVAASGLADPMISGRSLGHTGGTLDKLETIPGFVTQLTMPEFLGIIRQCGFAMAGQTPTLVPADRILYGLRDHTGTVESPYLITASIMSKKLAEGLNALVLDVKTGTGAFMSRDEDAELLARLMVETGELAGTRTVAVLTAMNEPLGRYAGNWVEVQECVELFQHFDPAHEFRLTAEQLRLSADLLDLTHTLAGHMLHLGGKAASAEAGARLSAQLLADGSAYRRFLQVVELQSVKPEDAQAALREPAAHHAPVATRTLLAESAGWLTVTDCTRIGWAVQRLGAGRTHPGAPVSAHAGLQMHGKAGDAITCGQPLVTLYAEDAALLDEPEAMLREVVLVSAARTASTPLIRRVVGAQDAVRAPLVAAGAGAPVTETILR